MIFPDPEHLPKEPPQNKFSSWNDGRQPRNDRPPRFQRDSELPKSGLDASAAPQRWRGGPDGPGGGGPDRWHDEGRGGGRVFHGNTRSRDNAAPGGFPHRTRDPAVSGGFQQGSRDHSGSGGIHPGSRDHIGSGGIHQGSRDQTGSAGFQLGSNASFKKTAKDNGVQPKLLESNSGELDIKGRYRPENKFEANSKRRGAFDRPQSDTAVRKSDVFGSLNSSSSWGDKDTVAMQDLNPIGTGGHVNIQNGYSEHRRTGPIKQQSGVTPGDGFSNKNISQNSGPKKRSGPIKSQKGGESLLISDSSTHGLNNWKPGDQCLALYWEDNKVSIRWIACSHFINMLRWMWNTFNVVSCTDAYDIKVTQYK